MDPQLLQIIPSILWFILASVVLLIFYRPICELLPKISGLKTYGLELSFIKESMNAAIELAEKCPEWKVEVSSKDKERVLNRLKQNLEVFNDAYILWVDDNPKNNHNERRMFRQLKANVDIARSTEEALNKLSSGDYHLVISDMARDDNLKAGIEFLEKFRKEDGSTPVIFYVGVFDPKKSVPSQASGITNRPDELLHLTLDALERKKY